MNTNRFIQIHRLRLLLVGLTLLWTHPVWAQEQVSKVVSSGGGFSAGGNYSNFAVVGGEPVSASFSGGNYSAKAGFIYRTDSALPGLPYLLTIDVVPAEAGIASGGGYFHKGTGVAVSATPNSGYTFVGWSAPAGGIAAVNSPATTYTMPGQNVTLTAHFAEETSTPTIYSVALSVNSQGFGTVTGAGDYIAGSTINLTATPSEGYRFLSWKEGTTIVSTNPNFSFNVTRNRNLVAHFALKNYTVTLSALPQGNIGGAAIGAGTFAHGTQVTVRANANLGFTFEGWEEYDNLVSTDNIYTFTITSNRNLIANFDGQKYSITTNVSPVETGTTEGNGEFYEGDIVSLVATPAEGYYFVRWMNGAQQVSVKNPYLFSALEDRNLTAEFAQKWWNDKGIASKAITYLITADVSPSDVGIVLGQGNYNAGDEVTLTASPNEGISFIKWTEDGVDVSTDATYVFTASSNRNLVAVFDGTVYNVTVESSPLAGGASTVSNDGNFFPGDFATVNANANSGYAFVNWTLGSGGSQLSVNQNYGFTVNADRDLVANFDELEQFDVTITVNPVGAGSVSGDGSYTVGSQVNLSAQPNEGYEFVYWSSGAELISYDSDASINVNADIELEAYFAIKSYTLTYVAGTGGNITGTTSQTVSHGSDATAVTAVPSTGYSFVNWSDGSTQNPRTDLNVKGDLTVTANFAINTFTLTYTAGTGGTITGTSPQTVDHGASGTAVTAVPNTGYSFVKWSDDVTANPRTDVNVTANISVTAQFAINTYTLTYTAGTGGTISGTSPQTVDHGASGTAVTAIPNTGYSFVKWSDDVTANPRTDANVTANISVTAQFAVNIYTLTYTAGTGGTISGTSPQTVDHGASGTAVTAVPNTGYSFVKWSDDVTANPRTDANVTGNISVTAEFAINTYTLTYSAGEGGSITGTSPQTVAYGASGTAVTAEPNTGYYFVNWSDGLTTATRTDANVMANITVTANFSIESFTLSYTAGEGGSISGSANQNVDYGGSGTAVEAIPDVCYLFVAWSDGVTDNPRTDLNVTGSISVTAIFEEREIDATVTVVDNTITANNANATYQWIDCGNGNTPIDGATGRSFTPTVSGTYAVIVTEYGCSATSECVQVSITSIYTPFAETFSFKVFPNPSNGEFNISSSAAGEFAVVNSLGQVVRSFSLNATNGFTGRVNALGTGVYMVIGSSGNQRVTQKVVVTK